MTGGTEDPAMDADDELTDAYPEAAADIARFTRRPA